MTKIKKGQERAGGGLTGYIMVSYDTLKKLFGCADYGGDGKVFNEWFLELDGERFSIYDYNFDASRFSGLCMMHIGGDKPISDSLMAELRKIGDTCHERDWRAMYDKYFKKGA